MRTSIKFGNPLLQVILPALCLTLCWGKVSGQYSSVPVAGFNSDQVADGVGPATGSTTAATDGGVDGGGFVFIDGTYNYSGACPAITSNVLPASNQISSTAAPGLSYTLQPYNNGANVLRIPATGGTAGGSGTLTLSTPTSMARLYLLLVTGGGSITNGVSVIVTFTDATTETLANNVTTQDWCQSTSFGATTVIPQVYHRLPASTTACGGNGTCQYLFEMSLPISGANYSKQVASVTITKAAGISGNRVINVFAVGMQAQCSAPATQPVALTQSATGVNQVSGSFSAAPGGADGYLVVRYPAGSAVMAPSNGSTYATGGALGAGTVVQSAVATSLTATGLSAATMYDFYVYAYNGTGCGGPVYNTVSPLTATFSTSTCGGGLAAGTYSVGPSGTYNTLTQALSAISQNGVAGPVVFELQPAYTSAGETFPIMLSANACMNTATQVTIRPEAGASNLIISSNNATATVDINSGTFFTLDGRPGGIGTTQALTIQNTATAGVAIRFINEAIRNRVTYCNIQGVNTANTGGVVQFATTTGPNGNDSNAIMFCNISGTSSTNTPATLIFSSGSTGNITQYNNNDTVTNCNLYNYFQATAESNAFKLGNGNGGNANWAILNNSIYQTVARAGTGAAQQYAFNLNCPLASGYIITGNYIGGTQPQCGGTPWTSTNSSNFRFTGTYLRMLPGGAQSVFSGNTFANFSWTNTGTTTNTSAPGLWSAVQLVDGAFAITNNIIGSSSGNSITVSASGTSHVFGIIGGSGNASTTYNVNGNTVAGITTTTPSSTSVAVNIYGISISSGSATTTYNVTGNTIGSLQPNSLFASRATTGAQVIRGIENTGGGRVNITNNVVKNLNNASVATGTTAAQTVGIATTAGVDSIAGNIVTGLANAALQTNNAATAAVVGILQISTSLGNSVNKNTVYGLYSNMLSAGSANVIGIHYLASTVGANTLAGNFVHSLVAPNNALATSLTGMLVVGGSVTVQNNMVRLGIDSAGATVTSGVTIIGIGETSSAGNNYFHNSVYIGGTGTSGGNTFAFSSTAPSPTLARGILNNIFSNVRSIAMGSGISYGMRLTSITNLTSNGNVVPTPNLFGAFGFFGSTHYTLQAWQAATGLDASSATADPQFVSPASAATTVDLHINASTATPVEGAGVAGTATVIDDFDGQSRASLTPVDIGADAGNFIPQDVLAPNITYTPLPNTYTTGSQTITATITDATGVPTSGSLVPRIYFKKFAASIYASTAGVLSSGMAQNGTWTFTIDPSLLGGAAPGDSFYYYIIAQDAVGNIGSNPAGAAATDVNTITTAPAILNSYRVLGYLSGAIPVGAGQTYTTLTDNGGLFQAIAINGLSGDVTAVVSSDLVESGTNALTTYIQAGGGPYRVTIVPDGATERLISGAAGSPGLIRFSGVRNAKINGAFNGSGRYLRLRNTNAGGSTVVYMNDAMRDTLMNCFVEGNNNTTGNICFRESISTGNDSNVVTGNVIRDLTNIVGLTNTGISSTIAGASAANSENLVIGNEFVNCIFNGINLNPTATGNNWQITNNSFYYTSALSNSGMAVIYVQAGSGHLISGNSIGGATPDRSGTATSNSNTGAINGIQLSVATNSATPTLVTGNTISNISTQGAALNAINVTSGSVTISGNTIGGGAQPYDTLRSGNTTALISVTGGTATITGNIVKSGAYYGTASVRLAGILLNGGNSHTVSGNTIDNLKSSSLGTTASTNVVGIAVASGTGHTVSGNTVSNIYNVNPGTAAYFVSGITANSGTGSTWARNRVYNIYAAGTGTGASAPQVFGLHMSSGSTENVLNNQIAVGANTVGETRVYGIQDVSTAGTHNYFNNAVYVSGATSAGSNNSYAFQRTTTTTVSLRNNILYNDRTTSGTGFNYALGISSTTSYSAGASNNNLLVAPDTTRMAELPSGIGLGIGAYGATFTAVPNANWMAGTGTVAYSQLFADVVTGNLAVIPTNAESWYANGKGLPLTVVATDYNGATRSTVVTGGATDIGSTEFVPIAAPPSATESAPPAVGSTNFYTFGGRTIARFTWDANGTPPSSLDVKLYSDSTAPNTGGAPAFSAFYDINASGGSGYGYTIDLAYDSSMLGTVPNSADARLARYSGSGPWENFPSSSASPVTGYLYSNTALNSFSLFTGASAAVPLAVSDLQIAAKADGDVNRIDWSASRTASGGRFLLERGADGIDFTTLSTIQATGASSYTHRDAQPVTGTSYYRVGLADATGTVQWSKVVSVRRSAVGTFAMSISPNPVMDIARVVVAGEVPVDARLIVVDVTGRTILSQAAKSGEATVDMTGLPAGSYILRFRAAGRSEAVKIVKQ